MKIKRFMHAQWNKHSKEFSYDFFTCNMEEYGYVYLHEIEIEFETPEEKELRARAAMALKKQAAAIRAKAFQESQEKEEDAQALLALEYTPEPPMVDPLVDDALSETDPKADDDLPF